MNSVIASPSAGRLHHLLLETQNLQASEDFYVGFLGFVVRKRENFRDGRRLLVTEQGLGLTEGGSGHAGVIQHVCFAASGVDEIASLAKATGVEIVRGPGPGPYGHTVYLRDPDGHEIELFNETDDTGALR